MYVQSVIISIKSENMNNKLTKIIRLAKCVNLKLYTTNSFFFLALRDIVLLFVCISGGNTALMVGNCSALMPQGPRLYTYITQYIMIITIFFVVLKQQLYYTYFNTVYINYILYIEFEKIRITYNLMKILFKDRI